MATQEQIQIKLHCISLAVEVNKTKTEQDVLNLANQFYSFVTDSSAISYVVTKEDLKRNPSLQKQGVVEGDVIEIPQ